MIKKSLSLKLILSFICIFVFSNVIASLMSYYGSELYNMESLQVQLEENLRNVSSLSADKELLKPLTEENYMVIEYLDQVDSLQLSHESLSTIDSYEILSLSSKDYTSDLYEGPLSIMKYDEGYLITYANFYNLGYSSRSLIMQINVRALIIGSILVIIASLLMIEPIKRLIEATKSVSKGKYDVSLETTRQDELGVLIETFNSMTKELQSIEMFRNDFISDISHEFRTPLTSIEGYVKLLEDASDDEKREYIQIITSETKRLSELSSNILTLNILENQSLIPLEDTIQLDEQIRKTLVLLEPKWSEKNLNLIIDLEPTVIKGHKNLLSMVWINLIDNAIKFTPENKTIVITLHNNELTIKDEGIGMSNDEQRRVFDKFYKSDQSRSQSGNGLGLPLVLQILNLHHTTLTLESKKDAGTLIHIKL